jgi:hypothetical protein
MYRLEDLLRKMGAPEARERKHIEWHYFDKARPDIAGFARVRLEDDGCRLFAELRHGRENYEDDKGELHARFVETFHLEAARAPYSRRFRVIRIAFDGETYEDPPRAVVELGLGVFHARALDISIRMVEESFNKSDILALPPVEAPASALPQERKEETPRAGFGVVIPFPRRVAAHHAAEYR